MPVWTLAYRRGAAGDERRARVLAWIAAGIDVGMVDFYLRWWSGHHCIDSGFGKLYQGEAPTGDLAPEAAVAQPNAPLYATFGKKRFTGLRLALMPLDLFPPPAKGAYAGAKATALAEALTEEVARANVASNRSICKRFKALERQSQKRPADSVELVASESYMTQVRSHDLAKLFADVEDARAMQPQHDARLAERLERGLKVRVGREDA